MLVEQGRPFADPIGPVSGTLTGARRLALVGGFLLGLQGVGLLAASAFDWGIAGLMASPGLGLLCILQGSLLLALFRAWSSLGRSESQQVPRALRQGVAAGGCLLAAGALLGLGSLLGSTVLGGCGLVAGLLGLETGLLACLQVCAVHPGRAEVLLPRFDAATAARATREADTPSLRLGPVVADQGTLSMPVTGGSRAGALRIDLARLPVVCEVRLPLGAAWAGVRAGHAAVDLPGAQPLGDPILDGLVCAAGPPEALQALGRDHGALLALLRGWPGSSLEDGELVLRLALPEPRPRGFFGTLWKAGSGSPVDVDHLLASVDEAAPALLALAEVLDAAPPSGAVQSGAERTAQAGVRPAAADAPAPASPDGPDARRDGTASSVEHRTQRLR